MSSFDVGATAMGSAANPRCGLTTAIIVAAAIGSCDRSAWAGITILGYEPRLHDLYYQPSGPEDPPRAFIGEGHDWSRSGSDSSGIPWDWSGIGTINERHLDANLNPFDSYFPMTMISERFFITAIHVGPATYGDDPNDPPAVRFYRTPDPHESPSNMWEISPELNSSDFSGHTVVRLPDVDIYLGRLAEAPPEWVKRYPLVKRNLDTNWTSYIDPLVYMTGQGADRFSYTTRRMGRNLLNDSISGSTTYETQSPPGLGADEARIESYDSASPAFVITHAGPALYSIATGIGLGANPTMPDIFDRIQTALQPFGEHVAVVTDLLGDLDADYDVDLNDRAILESWNPLISISYSTGDLNRDGVIDSVDHGIMTAQLGKTLRAPADFDEDDQISGLDFNYIADNWLENVAAGTSGDATGDGQVDRNDVVAFDSNRARTLTGPPAWRIAGDANVDGVVSTADVELWVSNYPANNLPTPFTNGDVDGDRHVTMQDLAIIRTNFAAILADVNGDGTVSLEDVDELATHWQQTTTGGFADGDVNLSGRVDAIDLAAVGSFLGFEYSRPSPGLLAEIIPGDFDGDLDVDGTDFLILQRGDDVDAAMADWLFYFGGAGAAAMSTPEPATCSLTLAPLGLYAMRSFASRMKRRVGASAAAATLTDNGC